MNHPYCQKVVFSNRAYNAVLSETYRRVTTETGGIFLGYISDGVWYILETLDPGPNSIFTPSYFEYDTPYVNNLAKSLSIQYDVPLSLLGLWHRHPGSFDKFSFTDDGTNTTYARLNRNGAISGLVNLDPHFRFTMYYVSLPLTYTKVKTEYGDEKIPAAFFKLKHIQRQESLPKPVEQERSTSYSPVETVSPPKTGKTFLQGLKEMFLLPPPDAEAEQPKLNTAPVSTANSAPQTNNQLIDNQADKEDIIDLLAKEALNLEQQIKAYEFEMDVTASGNTVVYVGTLKLTHQFQLFPRSIVLRIELKDPKLLFIAENKQEYEFSAGIFLRYVKSRIDNSEFKG